MIDYLDKLHGNKIGQLIDYWKSSHYCANCFKLSTQVCVLNIKLIVYVGIKKAIYTATLQAFHNYVLHIGWIKNNSLVPVLILPIHMYILWHPFIIIIRASFSICWLIWKHIKNIQNPFTHTKPFKYVRIFIKSSNKIIKIINKVNSSPWWIALPKI